MVLLDAMFHIEKEIAASSETAVVARMFSLDLIIGMHDICDRLLESREEFRTPHTSRCSSAFILRQILYDEASVLH